MKIFRHFSNLYNIPFQALPSGQNFTPCGLLFWPLSKPWLLYESYNKEECSPYVLTLGHFHDTCSRYPHLPSVIVHIMRRTNLYIPWYNLGDISLHGCFKHSQTQGQIITSARRDWNVLTGHLWNNWKTWFPAILQNWRMPMTSRYVDCPSSWFFGQIAA